MSLPNRNNDKAIREARNLLWEQGILEWKLSITQKKMYDFYHGKTTREEVVFNCSRRLGKSYLLIIMALEQCLKHPKSIVKFLQPKVNMIRKNLRPIFTEILKDCPKTLKPEFKTMDNMWVFPNGSEIHLAGTDNGNAENLRGGDCHLGLIDEAGFCDDLLYIVNSILAPTMTMTRGRIILCSTTPPNPAHEFIQMMDSAAIKGNLIRKTIYDAYNDDKLSPSPRVTEEIIAETIATYSNSGGETSDSFRTEFLCEVIYNSKDSVVPEFTKEIQQDTLVEWLKPAFFDRYVSMDIGFRDLTVVLFGYWDFDHAVLVIEDEFVINGHGLTTKSLAEGIRKKEAALWTSPITGETARPYLRVSDNNLIVINDLQREHGITFIATDKAQKEANLNTMRIMAQNRQIIISPKCKTLISHLTSATWDKAHKEFKRHLDGHHYDAVDALSYMVRNIAKERNPYPPGYKYQQMRLAGQEVFVNPYNNEENSTAEVWGKAFKRPSSTYRKINK